MLCSPSLASCKFRRCYCWAFAVVSCNKLVLSLSSADLFTELSPLTRVIILRCAVFRHIVEVPTMLQALVVHLCGAGR